MTVLFYSLSSTSPIVLQSIRLHPPNQLHPKTNSNASDPLWRFQHNLESFICRLNITISYPYPTKTISVSLFNLNEPVIAGNHDFTSSWQSHGFRGIIIIQYLKRNEIMENTNTENKRNTYTSRTYTKEFRPHVFSEQLRIGTEENEPRPQQPSIDHKQDFLHEIKKFYPPLGS